MHFDAGRAPVQAARTTQVHRARDQQRNAVRRAEGDGLRQHLGEHHHHHRHHRGGVEHADSPNQTTKTPVASADARMLTALLPSNSAPIRRSRAASRPVDEHLLPGCHPSQAAACWRAKTRSAPSRCRQKRPTAAGRRKTTTMDTQSSQIMMQPASFREKAVHASLLSGPRDRQRFDVARDHRAPTRNR